jgi:alpha-ketoglutarate-dependent taurine dioxygenase
VHPVVRMNAHTKRRSLYLNQFCLDSICELPAAEGAALLNELYEHCLGPEFVYTHQWRDGDVLVWDNLTLMHRLHQVPEALRVLHRTQTRA